MDILISRTIEPQPVCFAFLQTLYTGRVMQALSTSDTPTSKFFTFHSELAVSSWKWLSGKGLSSAEQLTRLLRLYRLGIEAELAGKWERANTFWDLAFEQAEQLLHDSAAWQTLMGNQDDQLCAEVRGQPEKIRQKFIEEIFIDTHCAFYNGYIKQGVVQAADSRAFVHWEWILKWLRFVELPEAQLQGLVEPASLKWISLCENEGKWTLALRICEDALKFLPGQRVLYERHAYLIFVEALSRQKLTRAARNFTQQAKSLENAITRLEDFRQNTPDLLMLYVYIGNLYHQLAITLANAGQLAEAIVTAQKALVYYPALQEAQKTRDGLIQVMQELQSQTARIQQQLAQNPRARLTPQGSLLIEQASRGLTPLETFMSSEQAGKISKAYLQAQAREIWRKIGLPATEISTDEMSTELVLGMSDVMNEKPANLDAIVQVWQNVIVQRPLLAALDSAQICAYIESRINLDEKAIVDEVATPVSPQPINPPWIEMGTVKYRRGGEPFGLWLFSGQDRRLKLQAFAAILLVLFASIFLFQQTRIREARETAYEALAVAAQNENYLGVIEAAEAYFSNQPLSRDLRDSQVRQLYDEAFVRWFVTSEQEPSQTAMVHIEFYKKHTKGANSNGGQQP